MTSLTVDIGIITVAIQYTKFSFWLLFPQTLVKELSAPEIGFEWSPVPCFDEVKDGIIKLVFFVRTVSPP